MYLASVSEIFQHKLLEIIIVCKYSYINTMEVVVSFFKCHYYCQYVFIINAMIAIEIQCNKRRGRRKKEQEDQNNILESAIC